MVGNMKNFNSIKATIALSVVLCYITPISAQSDSLTIWVDQVEQTLFAEDDYNCYLYEFMQCKEIHKPVYDSFQVVNCYQPDANEVNALLKKILWTKDPREYDRLLEVYKRYIELFLDQFEQVIHDNHYKCRFIKNLRSIASNFEMLLISLEFQKKGWSNQKIYQYYRHEMIKMATGTEIGSYQEIKDTFQFRFILQDFKKLSSFNPQSRLNHTIHYVDPYIRNFEPFYLNDLYKCDFCYRSENGGIEWDCDFVLSTFDFMYYYKSDSIENYFLENFHCWSSKDFVDRSLTDYTIRSQSLQLMSKIMDKFLKRTSETGKDYYLQDFLRRVLRNSEFLPLLIDKIIKIGEEDLEFAKNRLSYIPWDYRDEAKSYIKHNAPKESKLYQELSRGEKE